MITLHSHSQQEITRTAMDNISPHIPDNAGRYYRPISNQELFKSLDTVLDNQGFEVRKTLYSISKDETLAVSAYQLQHPSIDLGDEQQLSLGLIHGNNLRRPLEIYCGTQIIICTNGLVTGQQVLRKKHTLNLNLTLELDTAITRYLQQALQIPAITEGLKTYELNYDQTDLILMTAGRRGILPWSRIGQVDTEYRCPTVAQHHQATSWGLMQAMTQVVKKCPAHSQMSSINSFRELLPTTYDVEATVLN